MTFINYITTESNIYIFTALLLVSAYMGSLLNLISLNLPTRLFFQWKKACIEHLSADIYYIHPIKIDETPALFCAHTSCCSNCEKNMHWSHKIPLFGYLLPARKCKTCKTLISPRQFIVEVITVGITVLTLSLVGISPPSLLLLLLFFGLIILGLIDLEHQLLPDVVVLPLLWLGLIINYTGTFTELGSALVGAVTGYLSLWLIFQVHHQLTGKIGMGHGDFKLFSLLGAWFGWQLLPLIIFIASISGTLTGILMILMRKKRLTSSLSFGPHLAVAGGVSYLCKENINNYYLNLLLQWQ